MITDDIISKVLVLNSTSTPLNICSWKRALILLFKEKAENVASGNRLINNKYVVPLIIRLFKFIPLPFKEAVLTRKNVYLRDNNTCQYCGRTAISLTVDHVIPSSRGGDDSWKNVVTACVRCNNKKGDQLIEEAGMKLLSIPYKPPSSLYLELTRYKNTPSPWFKYFHKK
jgi:5-methylcytosine-specific restriction endonuclease McrA